MIIYPFLGVFAGLLPQNVGTESKTFAIGRTRAEVITKLLTN